MFNYAEILTETYDDKRWYHTPAGAYPSITTVLGHTAPQSSRDALEKWRNSFGHEAADAFTKARADHGTMVHLMAERYLGGDDPFAPVGGQEISKFDQGAFRGLKFKLDNITQVWGQEVALYSTELEVAGRCDLIGVYKNVPVIVDFKTSSRIKGDADIADYKLQLCFYANAHNEMFGTSIAEGIILMIANGIPMEFKIDLHEQQTHLKERVNLFWKNMINNADNLI